MSAPEAPAGGRAGGRLAAALCLAVLVAGAAMGLRAAREKSLTYDERYYTAHAAEVARGGTLCGFALQPPLTMQLAALGIRAGGTVASPWPRVPALVLLVATGALAAWWSSRLWGPRAAVVAAVLTAFSPNVLAHASMATTDFPVAALMLANVWALRGFLRAPSAARGLAWSVTFGLAALAKLTAVLLLPAAAVLAAGLLVTRTIRWRPALLWPVVLAPVVVAGLVWAAYGFTPCGFAALAEQVELRLHQNRTGSGYSIYVLGEIFDHGVWYYDLATTALKEPLPLVVLLAVACVHPVRPRGGWSEVAFLLVPAAIVVVAASASIHQLGHRYVLPAFLPLLVWVSGLAAAPPSRAGTAVRALVAVAAVLYVADALRIRPHFLAYTNQLIAPERAYHYLADSNLDWRQDERSPEVRAVRAEWEIVDPGSSHRWEGRRKAALLLGATELSGMWAAHGFWGSRFTLQVRERGYRPARHVAYSHFLFPLDSEPLVRDLHDWYLARSWVDARNLRVRFAALLGPPAPLRAVPPASPAARAACRAGVRRTAITDAGTTTVVLESFAGPPLPPPSPRRVEWSGAFRITEPAGYVVRVDARTRALDLGGVPAPLERNDAVPDAPGFAAVRLEPGLHPFVATQEGPDLPGKADVALVRLLVDAAGYATPLPLDLGAHLCLPDGAPPA